MSQRIEAVRSDPAAASAEARRSIESLAASASQNLTQTAVDAKPEVAMTAWLTFAVLVLSLLAAIFGAAVGRRGVVDRSDRSRAL